MRARGRRTGEVHAQECSITDTFVDYKACKRAILATQIICASKQLSDIVIIVAYVKDYSWAKVHTKCKM